MTPAQVATNNRALIAAAAKLEKAGFTGDSYRFVEALIVSVLDDGFRRIEKPTPRGPGSTEAGREAARRLYETTRREKENH